MQNKVRCCPVLYIAETVVLAAESAIALLWHSARPVMCMHAWCSVAQETLAALDSHALFCMEENVHALFCMEENVHACMPLADMISAIVDVFRQHLHKYKTDAA